MPVGGNTREARGPRWLGGVVGDVEDVASMQDESKEASAVVVLR